jgi:hypothetical protein
MLLYFHLMVRRKANRPDVLMAIVGMPLDWLVATWGSPFNRVSNLRNGTDSEFFTMDIQLDDLAILKSKPSVTHPHCLDETQPEDLCVGVDEAKVEALKGVTLIIDVSGNHGYDPIPINASVTLNAPVVTIDSSFDGALNCLSDAENYLGTIDQNCYRRSYLDVVNRMYDMAEWMGIDTRHDRDLLCKATQRFQQAAKLAYDNGIRFLLAAIQSGDFEEGNMRMYVTNPLQFSTARTMEEIGLPILWPGLCQEEICKSMGELPAAYELVPAKLYFPDCPEGQIEASCGKNTLYKADFLLLEGFGYQQLEDNPEAFKKLFPDPALLAGQFIAFPFDAHVFSHRSLAGWLEVLTERIQNAKRLHDPTPCSEAHVTSLQHINYKDLELGGGEYACWNPQYHNSEYATCPPEEVTEGLSNGAVAGVAVGAIFVGALLMFLVMKFVLNYHTGIDKKFQEPEEEEKELESNTSQASHVNDAA